MCVSELKPLIGPERTLSGAGLNEVIHKALSAANYYLSLLSWLHSLFRFHSLVDGCRSHNSSVRAPLSWHMYRLMLIRGARHTYFFFFFFEELLRWAGYLPERSGIQTGAVWLYVVHTPTPAMSIEFSPATFQSNDGSARKERNNIWVIFKTHDIVASPSSGWNKPSRLLTVTECVKLGYLLRVNTLSVIPPPCSIYWLSHRSPRTYKTLFLIKK